MSTKNKAETEAQDVTALRALRDLVKKFNAGAATRTEVTDSDQTAIEAIIEAKDRAVRASSRAWRTGFIPADVDRTLSDVARYAKLTTSEDERTIGGTSISMPAVESGAIRRTLAKLGEAICQKLDVAIAQAETRDKDAERQHAWMLDTVDTYLKNDKTKHFVCALLSLLDADDYRLAFGQTREALGIVINVESTLNPDFPRLATWDIHQTLRAWRDERGSAKVAA